MAFIRTLLGDIDPKDFGVCDSHEHLIRSGGPEVDENKDFLMDNVDAAKKEFGLWLQAGGKSMVCMDTTNCGRNVPKMMEIAEAYRGKGHLLMCTGFHKGDFYDQNCCWLMTVKDINKIVKMVCEEITVGLDTNSYNGPIVERIDAKAGLIKSGTSYATISDLEYRSLKVAALAQQETGAPISVHTQMGTMAYDGAMYLKENGADMEHTIMCHVQKNPDRYYHQRVMDTGAYICYDGPDRKKYFPDSVHVDNLKWLIDRGYQKQILLSMDAGRASYQTGYMELKGKHSLGIAYLLNNFVPELRDAGIPEDAIQDMLINNPSRAFAFKE